ncbi:MAG: low specificity L-threonine aldolase [Dysgonamonadaceae bacterium]|jgi:threonine aldolase|nr:low specificity L-threonine aldolase [Dysgonamonadaceae bacterium]
MRSFASDNNSGVHPLIMEAIVRANKDHAIAYGDDDYTRQAGNQLKTIFGEDIEPCFVLNGTGSNMVALQLLTRPFHSILTTSTGHIQVDECGAPAKFTSCMVKEIPTSDGKWSVDLIRPLLHGFGDQHHSQPKVIYLSQATELGTVYSPDELKAICDLAHSFDMYVHMDGSRLANACAYLNRSMAALSRDCGIDVLSLGGTKNGMMLGEVVIPFRPELNRYLQFYRKQSAQLYSKMRYHSAQFIAYFENDLWLHNARHANAMAQLLANAIKDLPGIRITQKTESNVIFLTMDKELIQKMRQSYFFYTWNEENNEIRLACSWDTTEEDVNGFVSLLKSYF